MPRPRTFTTRVRIEGTVHIRVDPRRPLTDAERSTDGSLTRFSRSKTTT